MNLRSGIDGLKKLPNGAVLSIGNFDGLHIGHAKILSTMRELSAGLAPVAVATFEPHPLTVLRPALAPPRLTPVEAKHELLAAAGVDELVVLPPERSVLDLSAEDFWKIVRDDVQPAHIVEGARFSFGKGRAGTIDSLRAWSAGTSVKLHVVDEVQVPLLDMLLAPASSSLVRWLLSYGRVRDAAIVLGRPYALRGSVIHGQHRGRTIGVPTANLDVADQLIPDDGVYAARCKIENKTWPVALSIGTNPTFDGVGRHVEAHLIGFDGDLYGQRIELELIDWLREQIRYKSIEPLKEQLGRDLALARNRALLDATRPNALA